MVIQIIVLLFSHAAFAQKQSRILNPAYENMLDKLLDHSVPEISCEELAQRKDEFILLDTREIKECSISMIEGARCVGYKKFNLNSINDIPKNQRIVCYCSVGYRSEKIATKLKEAGYTQVYNLYGSIFEWANRDYPLYLDQTRIYSIHGYNKYWSRWMNNKKIKKN
ncbi:MAG: rhodanese-like domain-containing protein [Bacteroidota bacterium]|nr:rhodanese-like domain-containing protein [Bacteroidota bacterium]